MEFSVLCIAVTHKGSDLKYQCRNALVAHLNWRKYNNRNNRGAAADAAYVNARQTLLPGVLPIDRTSKKKEKYE